MCNLKVWQGFILASVICLLLTPVAVAQAGSGSKSDLIKDIRLEGTLVSAPAGSGSKGDEDYRFKVTKGTDASSKEISMLKGMTLTIVKEGKGRELLTGHHMGDRLFIRGDLNVGKGSVEVSSFGPLASASDRAGSESKSKH